MPLSAAAQFEQEKQQNLEAQGNPAPMPTNSKEWDWKASPVNQKGETLPAGAQGWTPFGQPYFGPGLSGTLKRYQWSLMGSPGAEDDRWAKFQELTATNDYNIFNPNIQEAGKLLFQGMIGTESSQATKGQDYERSQQASERMLSLEEQYGAVGSDRWNQYAPQEVKDEYDKLDEELT
ncbi:MAG: hypothetical protein EHM40_21335, partial [Chloroflexi bacterium]